MWILHASIEEALAHAEHNLNMRDEAGHLIAELRPYLGTMRFSEGKIVGWQISQRRGSASTLITTSKSTISKRSRKERCQQRNAGSPRK